MGAGGGGGGGGGGAGGVGTGGVAAPSAGTGGTVYSGYDSGASPGRSRTSGGYNTTRKASMSGAMPIRSLIDPILSYVQATRGQL